MKQVFAIKYLLCVLLLLLASPGWSHPMPSSEVRLRLHEKSIDAQLYLPIIELKLGWEKPLPMDAAETVREYGKDLEGYVREHVHPVTPDGRPWTVTVRKVTPITEQIPDVRVDLTMTPPPGAPVDQLTLNYDVIFHKLITHTALVSIESDWRNGVLGDHPVLLGTLRDTSTSLVIDRSSGGWFRGFSAVFRLGMQHIAEGTDHLLFLLVLLLPASLAVSGTRWGEAISVRQSFTRLLKIVTAFTLGHSLTLTAGAVGWLRLPSQPVEVLIALSIFVSALHALRPLFPGREAIVAAGFGLVHGLAFATVVADFHLDTWQTVLTIFGFNLGIEAMQLIVLGVTIPWLLILARTPVYTPVRVFGAVVAGIAALGWMAERALGWANPIGTWVERAAAHAFWLVVALAVLSIVAKLLMARQRPTLDSTTPLPASSLEG